VFEDDEGVEKDDVHTTRDRSTTHPSTPTTSSNGSTAHTHISTAQTHSSTAQTNSSTAHPKATSTGAHTRTDHVDSSTAHSDSSTANFDSSTASPADEEDGMPTRSVRKHNILSTHGNMLGKSDSDNTGVQKQYGSDKNGVQKQYGSKGSETGLDAADRLTVRYADKPSDTGAVLDAEERLKQIYVDVESQKDFGSCRLSVCL
jgi:hypothetical protein